MKFNRKEVFFTSDTHFYHKNILKYCPNRKFSSVEDMNEGLIEAWNRKVPNGATVFHMGDFAFCSLTKMDQIVSRLNGNIHIIRGNHDADFPKDRFVSIQNYKEITVGDKHIILCHYPFLVWNRSHRESYNLHGHCHGTLTEDANALRMDIGVDTHPNLEPFDMDEIDQYMSKKEWKPLDHHDKETK
jgi:calcineurin-like phosphoesterase family protein